jgi:hypothetical protein
MQSEKRPISLSKTLLTNQILILGGVDELIRAEKRSRKSLEYVSVPLLTKVLKAKMSGSTAGFPILMRACVALRRLS